MALTNSQYDQIMRGYEARQRRARKKFEEKKEQIYRQIPELQALDEALATNSIQQAKLQVLGKYEEANALKLETDEIPKKKMLLLQQHGYTKKDLEPEYECPDCKDQGYIGRKPCHCLKQAAIDLVYTQSNLKRILQTENFDHLDKSFYSKELVDKESGMTSYELAVRAISECHHFIANFEKEFQNLLFYGSTGVGKTFLSNCVAKELLDQGHSVLYFTSYDLFSLLEKSKFKHDAVAEEMEKDLYHCDLLIIDDLGSEYANNFSIPALFSCLNERLLHQRSTIISSNLGLGKLFDLYSERTFSRIISSYTLIKLIGDDIRRQKKTQQYMEENHAK